MIGIDHALIHCARRFLTGENIHLVGTWIFCYENTGVRSVRERYEKLLREFVTSHRTIEACRRQIEISRERLAALSKME